MLTNDTFTCESCWLHFSSYNRFANHIKEIHGIDINQEARAWNICFKCKKPFDQHDIEVKKLFPGGDYTEPHYQVNENCKS